MVFRASFNSAVSTPHPGTGAKYIKMEITEVSSLITRGERMIKQVLAIPVKSIMGTEGTQRALGSQRRYPEKLTSN